MSKRKTIEEIKILSEKEGHTLLSSHYTNNKIRLNFKCPEGHLYSSAWNDFIANKRCKTCGYNRAAKMSRRSWQEILDFCKSKDLIVKSDSSIYTDNRTKLEIICKNNHTFLIDWNHLSQGHSCPSCFSAVSKQHTVIADFLKLHNLNYKENCRTIFGMEGKFEVDLLVDKLAIEIDGIYWHSENRKPNIKITNKNKLKNLRQAGFTLNAFYEDEVNNKPDLVKSMLASKLGLTKKIGARKTIIKKVEVKDRKNFFNKNHIENDVPAREAYGLYIGNELMCCISIRSNNKLKRDEIARFATKQGVTIVGGLSKLIKHLNRPLASYSNNRFGSGNAYKACGFSLVNKEEHQSYWYTDFKERIWRYRCRRVNNPKILALYPTEKDQAENGIFSHLFKSGKKDVYKIWDYGHRLWLYEPLA